MGAGLPTFGWSYPPGIAQGADAQQASAEAFRRMAWQQGQAQPPDATEAMRCMLNASRPTPEQQAEWERWAAIRRHVEGVRLEHGPDWAFWYWLCGLAAAAGVWRLVFR